MEPGPPLIALKCRAHHHHHPTITTIIIVLVISGHPRNSVYSKVGLLHLVLILPSSRSKASCARRYLTCFPSSGRGTPVSETGEWFVLPKRHWHREAKARATMRVLPSQVGGRATHTDTQNNMVRAPSVVRRRDLRRKLGGCRMPPRQRISFVSSPDHRRKDAAWV